MNEDYTPYDNDDLQNEQSSRPVSEPTYDYQPPVKKPRKKHTALGIVALALCCALIGSVGGGAVVGYVCDRYLRRNLLSALLMSLGCLIFCQGVLFLVQVFLGHVGFGAGLLPVLRQIGLSLLAAPPVYLAAWLIRKAGA